MKALAKREEVAVEADGIVEAEALGNELEQAPATKRNWEWRAEELREVAEEGDHSPPGYLQSRVLQCAHHQIHPPDKVMHHASTALVELSSSRLHSSHHHVRKRKASLRGNNLPITRRKASDPR